MFLAAAALLLAFVFGTKLAGAETGAWAAFETRCLGPMERIASPVTDGLTQRPSPLSDSTEGHYGGDAWFPDEGDFALMLTGKPAGCLVLAKAGGAVDDLARGWRAAALQEGRYVPTEEAEVLHSHLWREPVLAVTIRSDKGLTLLAATETQLES